MRLLTFFFTGLVGMMGWGALGQTTHVAYEVVAGQAGNQEFGGALGMDFEVANAVVVTRLGCFDDGSDGLNLGIAVRLYDRATGEVVAAAEFLPDDPGTVEREDGELVEGSRFLPLAVPLRLASGFLGAIVAEGYGPGERNGNRALPTPWRQDGGNGSLRFVGTSRYDGTVTPGAYPETPDAGPAARYAAGTFEFRTTPPESPGQAVVTAVPGMGRVELSWPEVSQPLPAVKYRVSRADSVDGVFAQVAEVAGTQYVDEGVSNGLLYCYSVAGVGAGGQVGPGSVVQCARPVDLGAGRVVAYDTPWGVAGNQAYGGSLGMDFDVINPIIIRELGCFDDLSDGLFSPISVRLYDRDTEEVVAELFFNPDDSGTPEREDGRPVGGMRFLPLDPPLTLPLGFRGTIQADGYGEMERNANLGEPTPWTTRDGDSSVAFVGGSRYGGAGAFPGVVDGGPAARYGAGTFIYETTAALLPGKPVVRLLRSVENHAVSLGWQAVTLPLPAVRYEVWRADAQDQPFVLLGQTTELTYRDADLPNGEEKCYWVRAIAGGEQAGPPSETVCAVPAPRAGGVAYEVPAETLGNQSFGGALGMDFEVERPILISRLGVFDSGSDGLFRTISARLYDRQTLEVLASVEFEPGDDGELVGGSRFKDLAVPLLLPAGFEGTIVASGYGEDEPNGNLVGGDLGLTTFGGGCLRFVGTSRYGLDPGGFADSLDGGPANRYAAGTFVFAPDVPPGGLAIVLSAGGVTLNWTDPEGTLERSVDLTPGSWRLVPRATPGMELPLSGRQSFYRLSR